MLLKEIKPGMVVHCKTQEEANILCDTICNTIVEKSKWKGFWVNYRESTCYKISNAGFHSYGRIASYKDSNITEFSDLILPELKAEEVVPILTDLILPELKAEEVVPILTEICNRYNGNEYCEGCPLNGLEHICNGNECPFTFKDYKQVMEICVQWKTNHERKEPEIETVDICRIIEIQPDGRKRCVHEEHMENIPIEEGEVRTSDRNIQKRCREILKRYCMEHDGEFIAVHEVVSRVKVVE